VNTREPVLGGISVQRASGSAFRRQIPSSPRISNLYVIPSSTDGTYSSHTPVEPSDRIGWAAPSQWLKSPMTLTPRALGAHTANDVPVTGPNAEA